MLKLDNMLEREDRFSSTEVEDFIIKNQQFLEEQSHDIDQFESSETRRPTVKANQEYSHLLKCVRKNPKLVEKDLIPLDHKE